MRPELSVPGTATAIDGPLLFLRRNVEVGLNEAVEILSETGRPSSAASPRSTEKSMVIEVLESTIGLGLRDIRVRFHRRAAAFRGRARPARPRVQRRRSSRRTAGRRCRRASVCASTACRSIRRYANCRKDFIETGVTAIDLMNSLVRGQKLPLFSGGGMPHDRIAIEIAQNARLRRAGEGAFAIVFVGIGISHDTAETFRRAMQDSGALAHTAMFLNLASESSTQRLLTPRFALTAAEYLAAEEGRHVLVIMTDMTNYCEALREVSASHGEVPSRKGYPGYMYSDLASIYERAGCIRGAKGTVTQLPILTMPAEDISHPIPGSHRLHHRRAGRARPRARPQRRVSADQRAASLSRLMDQGIGKDYSHPDHPGLANQLYASYAKAVRVRVLASVVGRDGLTPLDLNYLDFADQFESALIRQNGRRTLEDSRAGWACCAVAAERTDAPVGCADRAIYRESEKDAACVRWHPPAARRSSLPTSAS